MNTLKESAGIIALSLNMVCLGTAGWPGDWQTRQTPVSTHLTAVASAPGQLVTVGHAATILISPDGSSWNAVPYAGNGDFHCATFAKGTYVVGGTFECMLAACSDGVNWTPVESTVGQRAYFGVTYGGGRFVAVGRGGLIIPTRIQSSTNGFDWQPANVPPTTNTLRAVTFGNGKYIAVGERGTILTSPDAITWTLQISGTEHLLRSVIFTGREFLAGGDSSILLTSEDGISWLTVPFSSFDVRALATSGTALVGVGGLGAEGRLQSSLDGLSWSGAPEGFATRLNAVAHYSLGKFFAVGNGGLIIESGAVANVPVNAWTRNTDGYWHDHTAWSLGHVPSWADSRIAFTNGGSKTLEINAATTRDYPDSLRIRELLFNRQDGTSRTLLLNNAGWEVPLKVDQGLRLWSGVNLVSINSAIESAGLQLSGDASFSDTRAWFTGPVTVGMYAPANVVQSNGVFAAESLSLGGSAPGMWTQYGGTNETVRLAVGTSYDLHDGLVMASRIDVGGPFRQSGGAVEVIELAADQYDLSGGTLLSSNMWVNPEPAGQSTQGFRHSAGEHYVEGSLNVHGPYMLRGGLLSARRILIFGTLSLDGGAVSNHVVEIYSGRIIGHGSYQLGTIAPLLDAALDFGGAGLVLRFQDSSGIAWTNGSPLTITNWTPRNDQLFIGHNQAGLTAAQLTRIRFANPSGFSPGLYSARITPTGEVVPLPRLINYQRSAKELVIDWPEGYRLWTATNVAGPYSLITNTISPYKASYHTDPQRFFILRNEN
jgi:hypothetical protein